jgi:putative membrane protein
MITRKNLKFSIILKGAWRILLLWLLLASGAYFLYFGLHTTAIALPFAPIAVLGTALSIFLGFRNSSSYDRWWEARKIWGGIVNNSRTFGRQVITLSVLPEKEKDFRASDLANYRKELIYRQLAWVNVLRLQLRLQLQPGTWKEDVSKFLPEAESDELLETKNKATQIILNQAKKIAAGQSRGIFDDFRHIQLDNTLTEFYNLQGQCERIKNTPLPRQYDYFNRLFMNLFVILLPFSMLEIFEKTGLPILLIPFTVIIGFVFYIVEGVGRRNEDPFENKITDTPMSALCRTIEIDLREMLGEKDLPSKMEAHDGFLF